MEKITYTECMVAAISWGSMFVLSLKLTELKHKCEALHGIYCQMRAKGASKGARSPPLQLKRPKATHTLDMFINIYLKDDR